MRDPDSYILRLQEVERQLSLSVQAASLTSESKVRDSGSLVGLLSENKSGSSDRPVHTTPTMPGRVAAPQSGNSVVVEDDGSVTYEGRTFQLYRRYAGKSVVFIEEDGELKFSVEGKVLSKSFKL